MSDWIEIDGKKYYEESYVILANETAKRRGEEISSLNEQLENLQATFDLRWDADIRAIKRLLNKFEATIPTTNTKQE